MAKKSATAKPSNTLSPGLATVVASLNKTYGINSVIRLSDEPIKDVEVISSGSLTLDLALGVGGYAKGRIIEIYGPESSGKTTLTIHAIAECQKNGGVAAFIDAEHAFDPQYAQNLGVDFEKLLFSQPDNGEQALEIADALVNSKEINLIVIDSVAALVPKSEIEGEMGDSKMGVHARLMSQAMRKMNGAIKKNNVVVIFINQIREKIGVTYGSNETTTGGNALKFYSSMRLDVRKIAPLKEGDEQYGNRTRVKVIKNKCAPPFKKAEFDIVFGKGVDRNGELVDMAVELEIIKKSGSWYSYGTTKLGQGRDGVITLLGDNIELSEEIQGEIMSYINNKP